LNGYFCLKLSFAAKYKRQSFGIYAPALRYSYLKLKLFDPRSQRICLSCLVFMKKFLLYH